MTVKGHFYQHIKELSRGVVLKHEYRGRTLGFDCSMLTHKFMLRDPERVLLHQDFTKVVSAHVYHAVSLQEYGVDCVYVLDGWPCPSKAAEDASRAATRDEYMRAYLASDDDVHCEICQKLLRKACGQTWALKRTIIEAFRQRGIRYIVAPYEADSQLAWMAAEGLLYAVVGDDADFICMGCPRVVRHLNVANGTATEYSCAQLSTLVHSKYTRRVTRSCCLLRSMVLFHQCIYKYTYL